MKNNIQKAVHPSEVIPGECLFSSKSLGLKGITVESHNETPGEYSNPPLTENLILISLDGTNNQVSRFGGKSFEGKTRPGHIQIVPHNVEGFFAWDTYEQSIEIILEPEHLTKVASMTFNLNPENVELIPDPEIYDPQISGISQLLKTELETKGIGSKIYTETLTNALVIYLLRNYSSLNLNTKFYEGGLSRYRFRKVEEYINENLSKNLSLEKIAAIVDMSQFHFARLFKQSTGIPPHRYVINARIDRAKRLLEETDLGIAEIALEVGFSNQSHLSQHFRKTTGVTPLKYRKKI